MTRINHYDVSEVLETDLSEAELEAFIADAHRVVEDRCVPYCDDEGILASIEMYLAAHLATSKDPRVSSVSHEGVDAELGTDGDRYWHQAVLLDPTNRLARPGGFVIATT
ncbi:hypothetical protein [Natrialba asiatica]|uniref:Uncharacterized protein n=1 Tax=Natrialba asiatica (strain ATCC 700177 / DSM 12278 / JCM 9576 / FERM P-10747 / NBRC 102637 / 172P1) TaxID=29540 RepID=M0AS41_NATA1|nr:hypothetical protein [Natrialba asiatica]ELZ00768.1 hypothetical protein C481_11055 [Natrialba asiatica DSM 12278]